MPALLDAARSADLLPYPALIDALAQAAADLVSGVIVCPERQVIPMQHGAVMLSMAASAPDITVHKLVTVAPGNRALGLPTIAGHVSILDASTGLCQALLDGATVTGRRTAALSVLGIRRFLAQRPRHIVLIGTGIQAANHARALGELYPDAALQVLGRSIDSAQRFCETIGSGSAIASLDAIAPHADVVITATTSRQPVYTLPARAGRLLIGVGAFKAHDAEIAADTVRASAIYVDDLAGARHEAGDLLLAGVDWQQVTALGAPAAMAPPHAGQPILFKTVGCAAWDLAAGRVAMQSMSAAMP